MVGGDKMSTIIVVGDQVINTDRIQGGTRGEEIYIIKMVDGSFMFIETDEEIDEFLGKMQEYATLCLYSARAQTMK
jgi:O-acetylhomoserine/O-acetylserine sulfhydrylase-like pyridoxal-dependent enzyme